MSLTLIIDGRENLTDILAQLATVHFSWSRLVIFAPAVRSRSCDCPAQWLLPPFNTALPMLTSEWVGFIPQGAPIPTTIPLLATLSALIPWLTTPTFPLETALEIPTAIAGLAPTSLLQSILPQLTQPQNWTLLGISHLLEQQGIQVNWRSRPTDSAVPPCPSLPPLSVLAIVPHYHCEPWLAQCLRSLVQQTRPLNGIVVVDDASESPPLAIVQQFPEVTLLASAQRVGPYRLVQQVIEQTHYEAYLFQDADDWSTVDRLQILLELMANSEAELVGTQEIRVHEPDDRLSCGCYPLDVNAALKEKPGHPLLHPTSLVRRDLVLRLGGFASGLLFGGDTEFLLRAHWVTTIRNSPQFCYFRRKRPGSLTTDPKTGLDSPARLALLQQVKQRAYWNRDTVVTGQAPNLAPLTNGEPIKLQHLAGPALVYG